MDPRKKKQRNLRRSFCGGDRPNLYHTYDEIHSVNTRRWIFRIEYPEEYHRYINHQYQWIHEKIGIHPSCVGMGMGNASARFRRTLNRNRRSIEKQYIRNFMKHQDWDDFNFPKFKRDVNYIWF